MRGRCNEKTAVNVAAIDECALEKDSGPCPGTVMRWHYNQDTDTCSQFIYGGCQGNANRFRTKDECVSRCVNLTPGIRLVMVSGCGA